ncbi:hypothetical protein CR513_14242, partial [Mucuna pruriens]
MSRGQGPQLFQHNEDPCQSQQEEMPKGTAWLANALSGPDPQRLGYRRLFFVFILPTTKPLLFLAIQSETESVRLGCVCLRLAETVSDMSLSRSRRTSLCREQVSTQSRELATLDVVYQPWCIQYQQLEPAQTYELKFGLIHLLPKFHGLAGEDPYKHLKELHVVCSIMRPQGIQEDYVKIKPVLFNTLGDMKRMFLEKFFPSSRTTTIKKEICGIRQHSGETLHECWQRFNKLCATCPHHHISEKLLIQYFYEGLTMMDRSMIDAASGGALMDKTPSVARHLISNMTSNTQQFGIRGASQPQMVNEIG